MNHTYVLVWSPTLRSYIPAPETARRQGKRTGGKALLPAAAVLSAALLSPPGFAQAPPLPAGALPAGGQVVAGQASIGQHGSQMTINQGSDKAILNWNSFNIGRDAHVRFQQPGSSAVALNRVVAGDASQIQGRLSANGQVWLVNPNGVVFGPGSKVDVGGLVASTLNITDQDFLEGKAVFTRQRATGGITNQGQITATGDGEQGGLIALLAPTVRNDGILTARMGNVALAAGDQITLDAGAGGLLQVQVQPSTLRTLVENRQLIVADGGQVVMTGKAADALSGGVVANTGTVQARTLGTRDGRIMLLADGEHGSAQVSGLLDASGPQGQGGSIAVTGHQVALAGATLDASGATGGGKIEVGGGWQGSGTLSRAKTTRVDAGTSLKADATQHGDGGTVVVWSDEKTQYAGNASARGGAAWGNGGEAEVSGKAVLEFKGTADLSAAKGRFGELLLDPYNLTIVSGSGGTPVAAADDSTLGADTLTTALAGANVTVSTGAGGTQAGNITVDAPVTWGANTTLTLQAAGDIAIKKNVTATGASAGVVWSHGVGKDYQIGEGASVTLSGASATLQIGQTGALNSYTLLRDVNQLQGIPGSSNGYFALPGDIDASPLSSGAGFAPIANFGGTFTGLGHAINGLTIDRPAEPRVGLFGTAATGSVIRNVGAVGGSISGRTEVGGLVGRNEGTLSQVFATGTVKGVFSATGGLVGLNLGAITHAYATGDVSASGIVGGLVGDNSIGSSITRAYATGVVTGTADVAGGLVGVNRSTIAQAYATGAVNGPYRIGGLVGSNEGASISDAYATGALTGTGTSVAGGLVGNSLGGPITRSFYTTTQADGSPINNGGATAGIWTGNAYGTGKTLAELMSPTPFSGWDPAIWNLARGSSVAGHEVGLPALIGVTPAANVVRTTLFQGGMGIAGNPYGITDWQQLANIDQVVGGGYTFNLSNNLDTSSGGYTSLASATANGGLGWKPLGNLATPFIGTLDGQNRTISGLFINRPTQNDVGLFGRTGNGSVVRNIGLLNANVTGRYQAGALAGFTSSGSTISQAFASGDVKGERNVGGLVGANQGAVSRSYASAAVIGSSGPAGGLAGINEGTIADAYATGAVSGADEVGGLVGSHAQGTINHAYATGAVLGTGSVGGLVGNHDTMLGATVSNAFYATTDAAGSAVNNGGATTGVWTGNATGTGKTYAELKSPATFTGWDTSIWTLARGASAEGYETGLMPALTGVTRAVDMARTTLFQGGMGIAGNPYGITDWQQLANIGQVLGGGYTFNLNNNLDGSSGGYTALASATANGGLGWTPLGKAGTSFTGTFDGQNRTISGLVINRPAEVDVGLFGRTASGSAVRNIGLLNANVAGLTQVGGLAGRSLSGATIDHAYVSGEVKGTAAVGGLVGTNDGAISKAYANAVVTGSGSQAGGLVGVNNGTLNNSYATGNVTGGSLVGGLVGWNLGAITYAYATGSVSGSSSLGGLVGEQDIAGSPITNAFYATTNASGSAINNGGVAASGWFGNANGAGRTYVALMSPTTFSGWDPSIWTQGRGNTVAGYEVGLPSLIGVTRAADMVRSTLFQGGMGTAPSPYGITDWQQLANINQVLGGGYTFDLNNNLDSSSTGYAQLASATANGGLGWQPLGTFAAQFAGTFDGKSHTINALMINRPNQDYVGLFGYSGSGSTIRNLGMVGGNVTGQVDSGGLVGRNAGTVSHAYATGNVQSNLAATGQVGGLVGTNEGSITHSYATGNVTGTRYAGGLAGANTGSITQAYAIGSATATDESAGGLVGINTGSINQAYATGAVDTPFRAGGLVGNNLGPIAETYATGAITGVGELGGLVGLNNVAPPTNSFYATTATGGGAINNDGATPGAWTGNANGTGKTYAELTTPATFAAWGAALATQGGSAAVWRIYAGNTAPLLRSFLQAATVTADLSAAGKTYDGTIASGTATYTKNVPGSLLGTLSYASNSANAGSYTNTDGTLQLGGLYSGPQGYDIAYAPVSLTITPAPLVPVPPASPDTILGTLVGTVRKTYDGTTSATLDSSNFLLSGWVGSDGATVTQTRGRFDNANAGSGKTVTVDLSRSDYRATGATNLGNYILPTQIRGAVGTVDKALLTVTAIDVTKAYDGQAWHGGNGVGYSGFVNGETAAVLTGTLGYGGSAQGAVSAGSYVLTARGLQSDNYAIGYRDGTLAVTGHSGGGNTGGGNPGGAIPGGGNPGGGIPDAGDTVGGNNGGNTGGIDPGTGNGDNGAPPVAAAQMPSAGSLWRALNRATPPFTRLPQDNEPARDHGVAHLSLARDYIRLRSED
jgi:filamentous hemagglutinin family protein